MQGSGTSSRLCKVYGRIIDCPALKPHDLRHRVAMEVMEVVGGNLCPYQQSAQYDHLQ